MSIPVLEGYSLIMPEQEWARSKEGMNPVEISISVSMPEFDGIIHGVPVAAKHMKENGEVEYLPISEHILLRSAILSAMPAKPQIYTDPCPVKDIP